jgi:hypothetical protein
VVLARRQGRDQRPRCQGASGGQGARAHRALPPPSARRPLTRRCSQDAADAVDRLGELAGYLQAAGEADLLRELRAETAAMLEARAGAARHQAALEALAGPDGYVATGAATDFGKELKRRAAAAARAAPYDAAADGLLEAFDEAAAAAGPPEDERVDDDIEIEGGAGGGARNARCPITSRPITELEDPVADALGFVYERAAVEDYIARRLAAPPRAPGRARGPAGTVPCPVANTMHAVSAAELKSARALVAAARRAAAGAGSRRELETEVLDVL